MAKMSWKKPPPAVVIGGNEAFLREREIRNAILHSCRAGHSIVFADTDSDVVDALTAAGTFGDSSLIIVPAKEVAPETLREHIENPIPKTCILVKAEGQYNEKRFPAVGEVHAAFQVQYNSPGKRWEKQKMAVAFARSEANRFLNLKNTLDAKLAEALVKAVGTDLGTISHELLKMCALARARGDKKVTAVHVRAMVRASTDLNMDPLREALRARNAKRVALEMDRIKRNGQVDSVMQILRGKGGLADLTLRWLKTSLLVEKGADAEEISARFGISKFIVERDLVPASRRWGSHRLRELVSNLARADRAVKLGAPSPWLACESALLIGCSG